MHQFSANSRILCMTTYAPDQFAILIQGPNHEEEENAQLWTLNLTRKTDAVLVGEVAEAGNFVGMTPLSRNVLLASNSNGAIHRIELDTGNETALFTDPTMANGIGGINYAEPFLYFVAPVDGTFARFQLDPISGDAIAPVEVIAKSGLVGVADFSLATWIDHVAYLVNYEQNSILKVDENAKITTVTNGWRAPTSITIGRTEKDRMTLYVGTAGTLGLRGMVVGITVQ